MKKIILEGKFVGAEIENGKDLLEYLSTLSSEQLEKPIYFDTEARKFEYHYAKIGSVYYEDCDPDFTMIQIVEK